MFVNLIFWQNVSSCFFLVFFNYYYLLYSLGFNSNLNVSNLDVGFKEPQSRLKKWTAMDISVNSPLIKTPANLVRLPFFFLIPFLVISLGTAQ